MKGKILQIWWSPSCYLDLYTTGFERVKIVKYAVNFIEGKLFLLVSTHSFTLSLIIYIYCSSVIESDVQK